MARAGDPPQGPNDASPPGRARLSRDERRSQLLDAAREVLELRPDCAEATAVRALLDRRDEQ